MSNHTVMAAHGTAKSFVPSEQQAAFFADLQTQTRNRIMIAVAGSGKTTTIMESMRLLRGESAVYMVYNKKNAAEAQAKLKESGITNVEAGTIHSLMWKVLKSRNPRTKVEGKGPNSYGDWKSNVIMKAHNIPWEQRWFLKECVNMARACGFGLDHLEKVGIKGGVAWSFDAWLEMVRHYSLDQYLGNNMSYSAQALKANPRTAAHAANNYNLAKTLVQAYLDSVKTVVDFEDMVYATLHSYSEYIPKYAYVYVDECQDLNVTRRMSAGAMMAKGGQAVFVGDPCQAIYGFSGADAKSIDNIKAEYATLEMPLTVSFRCPRKVVQVAQRWVSHIQPHPDAPEGVVEYEEDKHLTAKYNLGPKDAVICRNNAPLVELFFRLLRAGIPAQIEGRDVAEQLISLTRKFSVPDVGALIEAITIHRDQTVAELKKEGRNQRAKYVEDICDALIIVCQVVGADQPVETIKNRIDGMFVDQKTGEMQQTLRLSTIHKAKGLEWERVFWLGHNAYHPSTYAKQPWELEQEANICYVAATRAKHTLVMLAVDPRTDSARPAGIKDYAEGQSPLDDNLDPDELITPEPEPDGYDPVESRSRDEIDHETKACRGWGW